MVAILVELFDRVAERLVAFQIASAAAERSLSDVTG